MLISLSDRVTSSVHGGRRPRGELSHDDWRIWTNDKDLAFLAEKQDLPSFLVRNILFLRSPSLSERIQTWGTITLNGAINVGLVLLCCGLWLSSVRCQFVSFLVAIYLALRAARYFSQPGPCLTSLCDLSACVNFRMQTVHNVTDIRHLPVCD